MAGKASEPEQSLFKHLMWGRRGPGEGVSPADFKAAAQESINQDLGSAVHALVTKLHQEVGSSMLLKAERCYESLLCQVPACAALPIYPSSLPYRVLSLSLPTMRRSGRRGRVCQI